MWESKKDNRKTTSTRTTFPGDNIELYFSLPSGFYANIGWLTYDRSGARIDDKDSTWDNSEIDGNIGMLGSSGALSYDVYLNAARIGGSITVDGDKAVTLDSYTGVAMCFDFGYTALQNETARFIIGSNNGVGVLLFDKIRDGKGDYRIIAKIRPNLLSEVVLSERWLAFAGASQHFIFVMGDRDRNEDTSYMGMQIGATQALFAGMRYHKSNFALETQVYHNPFEAFIGRNILVKLGGFVYF
jgi:hypothetical protein